MIDVSSRPRLARKIKLRFDRKTARHVLLLPEKGLLLNRTASAVAVLCTGELSVAAIIQQLAEQYIDVGQAQIEQEVLSFLGTLSERGLLETGI
jgi:pyrroloquinoline quinone biosynthesis protein D